MSILTQVCIISKTKEICALFRGGFSDWMKHERFSKLYFLTREIKKKDNSICLSTNIFQQPSGFSICGWILSVTMTNKNFIFNWTWAWNWNWAAKCDRPIGFEPYTRLKRDREKSGNLCFILYKLYRENWNDSLPMNTFRNTW